MQLDADWVLSCTFFSIGPSPLRKVEFNCLGAGLRAGFPGQGMLPADAKCGPSSRVVQKPIRGRN